MMISILDTAGEYSSQALQGIGSGSIAPLGTAHFVHVHRTFCSYLPHISIMFIAQFVRIYRTFSSYILHILIIFTAHFVRIYRTFTTFWNCQFGRHPRLHCPSRPDKKYFFGGRGGGGVAPIEGR